MNKKILTLLVAVMLCVAAFVIPAGALPAGDASQIPAETSVVDSTPIPDPTLAPTEPVPATTEPTPTQVPTTSTSTAPTLPDGNLTLVGETTQTETDYAGVIHQKQFVILQTKTGNTYYLIIDRSVKGENVYMLDMVDEADLLALIEADGTPMPPCTCAEKCVPGYINTECLACRIDASLCTGAAPSESVTPAESAAPEPDTTQAPTTTVPNPSADKPPVSIPVAAVVAGLVFLGAGVGAVIMAIRNKKAGKPKQKQPVDPDDDDYDRLHKDDFDELGELGETIEIDLDDDQDPDADPFDDGEVDDT